MASYLYDSLQPQSQYYDRRSELSEIEYKKRLETSTTVYIGNLHCNTSESALYELFARAGQISDLIMGVTKEGIFAGFCFVAYQTHEEARVAVEYLSQTKLYDRVIRVDWDYGFKEGRQYGRGIDGYQKRDQYREANDSGRHNVHTQWKEHQRQQHLSNPQGVQQEKVGFYGRGGHGGYRGNGDRGRYHSSDHHDRRGGYSYHNQSKENGQGGYGHSENKYKKNYTQYKNDQQKREKGSQSPTERRKRFQKDDEAEE